MFPLMRLLLGSGRLPNQLRAELAAERWVLLEEGLREPVTYRRYSAPGDWARWRKEAASGSIGIASRRLLAWAGRFKHINVGLDHPVRATIEVVE